MKEKQSAFGLARVLAIFGGLLTIVSGVLVFVSLIDRRTFPNLDAFTNQIVFGLVGVVLGVLAVIGSRQVKVVFWDVALVIAGILADRFDGGFLWELGPIMVIVAGIVGIVAKLA